MFKAALWRSDKNKVKVVFKLQFHATQLTKAGGETWMISLVPADTGKPTIKSDKAVVRDGSCFWENPLYETVKFNRDSKSGKVLERIYYFVVGTGSSKGGVFGEASFDFSSFAEATKVSRVSLPLEKSQTEAVLHVSIQRIQESTDQRDVEDIENAKLNPKIYSLSTHFGNGDDEDVTARRDAVEDMQFNVAVSKVSDLIMNRRASSESDVTVSSFISGSKSDTPMAIFEQNQKSQWEWLGNAALEASTDDSSSTPRATFSRQPSGLASDILIENLKSEVTALSRKLEMSELELQTLRKQIVKESKRGQELSKEIACSKEENDSLKEECGKLKASLRHSDGSKNKTQMHFEGDSQDRKIQMHFEGDSQALVRELRQELVHVKELNSNLQIQLQKTQESNSELILAVQDLEEMLDQKNQEMSNFGDKQLELIDTDKSSKVDSMCETNDEEQKALEKLVKEHRGAKESYLLEQQMIDLRSEIEIYRRDKDELEMQMEQLALDYEIMKQENHEISYKLEQSQIQEQLKIQYECSSSFEIVHELECQVENLENELKSRSKEFADSLITISELETHVKNLEDELEKQAQGFEADLEALTLAKVEQEKRAIIAEETLRKTRCQNANTAERLQGEFKRLSTQMASTFDANEKLATKALAEANELRMQKTRLEEILQNASEEHKSVKGCYEDRLAQLSRQIVSNLNQIAQLEKQKAQDKETQRVLSDEILAFKDELGQMRKSSEEMALLLQKGNNERSNLESSVTLLKTEAEEWQTELDTKRHILEEKEVLIENLQSQLHSIQSRYDELKHSLLEDKSERDILKKQVSQLKNDLKKKDYALLSMERKMKDSSSRGSTGKSTPPNRGNKEVTHLKERIQLLEDQIMLKEKTLETSSNLFLKREKDLHNKIEELEATLEVLNRSSGHLLENKVRKVAPNINSNQESRNYDEHLNPTMEISTINDSVASSAKGEVLNDAVTDGGDGETINEVALLKEKNKDMEEELKEMQGRYSEISLKFAEVEGERQQLMMKLRNLKNARKNSQTDTDSVYISDFNRIRI
ncbi:myosin-9 [Dorcoceras hygrometricum]|uniref:Myosin-9 n=1 Tax=Dorcoceras hygrometricum TaxID=472368 RepID=A0A2Z7C923_9LAMI|nr:myosin-9 [Dorcoceras hygrometricum]